MGGQDEPGMVTARMRRTAAANYSDSMVTCSEKEQVGKGDVNVVGVYKCAAVIFAGVLAAQLVTLLIIVTMFAK